MSHYGDSLDRRQFLKTTAAGIGAMAAAAHAADPAPSSEKPKVDPKDLIWRSKSPDMSYVRLGRTNFMVSRIVSGLGGKAGNQTNIWPRELARGINYFDTARGYGNSEVNMKEFLKEYRKDLWVTSKASNIAGYAKIDDEVRKLYVAAMKAYLGSQKFDEVAGKDSEKGDLLRYHNAAVEKEKATGEKPDLRAAGKRMAEMYLRQLDESLTRLGTDHVDAYFMHGVEIPWIFDCIEVWEAFEKANKAGKAKHFGFSTHTHQKEVLAAAAAANERGPWKIDLIMPGVNPESFVRLRPELEALKKQDVGIVAMKTKGIVNRPVNVDEKKFSDLMEARKYNEWERAKLYMLHLTDGLIDAAIIAIESMEELDKDVPLATVHLSASARRQLEAIVKLETAGACHLCGDCTTHCPEHIAVTDMIRYHAYLHQYNDRDLARELYQQAGYDPARLCNSCGKCADVCGSKVPIVELLHELSHDMA
ncbi:MAG TPA: aldo/keto reductase [Phycisphaerae bacterium]|nr:aldo/keto reductase [Phycisphaerae bacterium]HPP27408.1 aldo/keto reductase [Phycisphaerae bacterium]HPU25704.1 aldo/keto reductase [Phycisphaerae bacterium]HPZ99537.1 aldo/keto reductase [Phycisphaerae bacterium]